MVFPVHLGEQKVLVEEQLQQEEEPGVTLFSGHQMLEKNCLVEF